VRAHVFAKQLSGGAGDAPAGGSRDDILSIAHRARAVAHRERARRARMEDARAREYYSGRMIYDSTFSRRRTRGVVYSGFPHVLTTLHEPSPPSGPY